MRQTLQTSSIWSNEEIPERNSAAQIPFNLVDIDCNLVEFRDENNVVQRLDDYVESGKKKQTNILLKSSAGIGLSSDDVGVSGAFLPVFLFWFPTKKRTQRLLIWDMRVLLLLIKEEEFKRVKNIIMIDILKKWMKNAWRWWKTHGGWNRSKYEWFINQHYVRSLV